MCIKINNINFEFLCKILIAVLFIKLTSSLTFYNSIIENFQQCCWLIGIMIVFLNVSRVIKLFMGSKGIEIELAKIEATKEEILEIQKNIRQSSKQILRLYVDLIEGIKRLTWHGLPNYDELIHNIQESCKKLKFSNDEQNYVFESKKLLEEKEDIIKKNEKLEKKD